MANAKITELIALTTPAAEDLLAIVDDPSGTPVTKRISAAVLFGNVPTDLMPSTNDAYNLGSADKRWKALILGTGELLLGDAEIAHENRIHDPVYLSGQTGLDDLSSSGTYPLVGNAVFQIRIQSTGTPDNFEWRKGTSGAWAGPVAMTGSAQLLQDGISITWAATTGHTLNDEWEMNVGHEVHISEPVHVIGDLTANGDIVVTGALRSLSPVRISGGIDLMGDAKISTSEPMIEFDVGGTTRITMEDDGTLAVNTVSYETLVTANNDIPNKKYVDDITTINKATGWLEGGQITINAGDNTKIDVSAGSVLIVTGTDNPIGKVISWDTQTALDPALVTRSTWVGIKESATPGVAEFVFDTDFDSTERRTHAILARIWNNAGTQPSITSVGDYERPAWGLLTAFQDFILEYGSWNISGNIYSANGTNLLLDKSVGNSFRYHAEDTIGQENIHTDVSQIPRNSYAYHLQGAGTTTTETDIDPDYYDNGGIKTALANNKWTVQEIWYFPVSGTCHVLYGQVVYSSKTAAIDGITTETKVRNIDMLNGAILRAYLVVEKGTTDLTDSTNEIREAKAGAGGSGGSSTLWGKSGTNISPAVAGDDLLLNTGETLSITDMTEGSIPFVGSGGLITQDNSNLFWNNTNNRLGIGSQNPKSPLHVKGNTPGTVGDYPAGQLIIQNPGINVNGNAAITGYTSDIAGDPVSQLWYFGSSSSGNQDVIILNRANANLHLGTDGSSKMVIAPDGVASFGSRIRLGTNGTSSNPALSWTDDIDTGLYRISDNKMALTAGGSEILRISNTELYASKRFKMVSGAVIFSSADLDFGSGNTTAVKMTLKSDGTFDVPGVYNETDASAANVFVASDGSLRRSTSSRKIKKDIKYDTVNPELALQFKPVTFKAKADNKEHIGFISEDMQEIDPRLATNGELPGLEMKAIVASLTALVQRQQRQIEVLERAIN